MLTPETRGTPSLVNRLLETFSLTSRRLDSLVNACKNPDCQRRSVRQVLTRKLDGIELAGMWFCSLQCYEIGLQRIIAGLLTNRVQIRNARKARVPLGLMLLSRGEVTRDQLRAALELHRSAGIRVGDALLQMKFVKEDQVASALAAQWGYPVFPANTAIHHLPVTLPIYLIELHRIMPLHFTSASRKLLLGFADGPDHGVLSTAQQMLGCAVEPCFVKMSEFHRRLQWLKTQAQSGEAVFDRLCELGEITQVTSSYIRQIGAERATFGICGSHLWVLLLGGKQPMNLLFRFQQA